MLIGLAATALVVSPGCSHAAGEPLAPAHCSLRETTFDSREVVCSFDATARPRRFRLQVNFAGGHDDTMARMSATLDGAAVTCEDGSKTSLLGEDGDVSLTCLLTVAGGAAEPRFTARFMWSHAQYVDYSFDAI